ncbi:hypothetical protein ISE1_2718 [plant metagenome]|uniref:Uncharacterized protein n=1 Tax=plant metagenome TaxID=1297885 RepID=A0A484UHR4_9ZZZZ
MTNPTTWPIALTTREQGDANHYAILHGCDWLAALQINGKLPVAAQADLVRVMAAAPALLDALCVLQANPNDPRAHRVALDALRLAGSTQAVRNYYQNAADSFPPAHGQQQAQQPSIRDLLSDELINSLAFGIEPPQLEASPSGNLATCAGWLAAAERLLAGRPAWTAIQGKGGYVVLFEGEIWSVPDQGLDHQYTPDDLCALDWTVWDLDAWEGMTEEECRAMIENPCFVQLMPFSTVR